MKLAFERREVVGDCLEDLSGDVGTEGEFPLALYWAGLCAMDLVGRRREEEEEGGGGGGEKRVGVGRGSRKWIQTT